VTFLTFRGEIRLRCYLAQRPPTRRFASSGPGFSNIAAIVDWMKFIKEVSVSNLDHNYSALAQLKGSISISDSNITDVSSLGDVIVLSLSRCNGIRDVSALGKVYNLNLSESENIIDVSALGNVHTLDLSNCPVADVSALTNVKELMLGDFLGDDISGLQNVEMLTLGGGSILPDLPNE
jgi:hypothetical protein